MRYFSLSKSYRVLFFAGTLLLTACHSSYELTNIQGSKTEISAVFDVAPDKAATALLTPYKVKVDSIMTPLIGTSEKDMIAKRPESLLSNLIADMLWKYTNSLPDQKADVAVINVGGLRSNLPQGDILFGTVYEILPFENSLCIVSLRGDDLKSLFKDMAKVGGEGVSNVKLLISKAVDGELLSATVGGEEIDDNKVYTVATLDYLAEGNDGLVSFKKAEKRVCPEGMTIRRIFLDYVKAKTAKGEKITSELDGRIQIKK